MPKKARKRVRINSQEDFEAVLQRKNVRSLKDSQGNEIYSFDSFLYGVKYTAGPSLAAAAPTVASIATDTTTATTLATIATTITIAPSTATAATSPAATTDQSVVSRPCAGQGDGPLESRLQLQEPVEDTKCSNFSPASHPLEALANRKAKAARRRQALANEWGLVISEAENEFSALGNSDAHVEFGQRLKEFFAEWPGPFHAKGVGVEVLLQYESTENDAATRQQIIDELNHLRDEARAKQNQRAKMLEEWAVAYSADVPLVTSRVHWATTLEEQRQDRKSVV